eukprot:scaffold52894_cov50-Phaeocystis_antarctica.AAC.2
MKSYLRAETRGSVGSHPSANSDARERVRAGEACGSPVALHGLLPTSAGSLEQSHGAACEWVDRRKNTRNAGRLWPWRNMPVLAIIWVAIGREISY